jgi:predicted O-methyltransferase YrrM
MNDARALPLLVVLTQVAATFGLDAPALVDYAYSDPHGGYNSAHDDGFPIGSLWRVEGQFLYALMRALRPLNVLELGTWHGASATHLLQAIVDNKNGGLTCVDNREYGDIVIGGLIPDALKRIAFIHDMRLENFIAQALKEGWTYDFIFEDAMHTPEQVALVWQAAPQLLNPGGMIVSHDAMHAVAGERVREGIRRAGHQTTNVLIAPADCGFALWRKGTA